MCHLLPEPDVLGRVTWEKSVLPKMSAWLGLSKPNLENNPGKDLLRASSVYPSAPLLSAADWGAISNYYVAMAPATSEPRRGGPKIQKTLKQFQVIRGASRWPRPATCLVQIDPAGRRIFLGDGQTRTLNVLDMTGKLQTSLPVPSPPVRLTPRSAGWYVTLIGYLFPSDDPRAGLAWVEPAGDGFTRRDVLQGLPRATDTAFADLNGDGREDCAVCMFGNDRGRFSWFENTGQGQFTERVLHSKPGAVRCYARDFNRDGRPDLIVLWAQAEEGVYLYLNQGQGDFTRVPLLQKHPAWGFSDFELVDWNGDGATDFIVTNGDNGDDVPASIKDYHGIRLYLNDGQNRFHEAFFFPLHGAYKAVPGDFDQDGDLDLAAISYFPDYERSPEESFVYLENSGNTQFQAHTFADCASGRWLAMDVGDLDGDGDLDIVLGSFAQGPPTVPIPIQLRKEWQVSGPSLLILKNTRK